MKPQALVVRHEPEPAAFVADHTSNLPTRGDESPMAGMSRSFEHARAGDRAAHTGRPPRAERRSSRDQQRSSAAYLVVAVRFAVTFVGRPLAAVTEMRAGERSDRVRRREPHDHVARPVGGEVGARRRADGVTGAGDGEAGQVQRRRSVAAVLDADRLVLGGVAVDRAERAPGRWRTPAPTRCHPCR